MNMQIADPCTKHRTLADVLATVLGHPRLKETRRRDLASALRKTARLLNRELAEIPADMGYLRERLDAIHPVQARIAPKRLANVKSDLAAALRLVLKKTRRPSRIHRTPDWDAFTASLEQPWQRHTLSRLATFCSLRKIEPPGVDDRVMAMFHAHLTEASLAKDPAKTCKRTIQTWNGLIERKGLPLQHLTSPASTQYRTPPLSDYPDSLQADVERWIARNTKIDFLSEKGPPRAARPQTLKNHRNNIRRFAAAVVARGVPIDSITSLAKLVELKNFKEGLRFFIARNDGVPPSWLFGMAGILLAVAKHHVGVRGKDLEGLRSVKAQIKVNRPGMTEKNTHRLAQFDDLRNVAQLMTLPKTLSERADRSPEKSSWVALDVMYAVAIEILLACPLRVGNLATLNIERHFIWRGQGNSQVITLVIPGAEVKNGQPIEADLPRDATRLIRSYVKTYRPLLLENPGDWLFPKRSGYHRNPSDLAKDISRVVRRETGLIMNAHLFRALAGMLFLRCHPGSYELVRRVLGHRSINTTINFYTSLESKWAFKHYDDTILSKRGKDDA